MRQLLVVRWVTGLAFGLAVLLPAQTRQERQRALRDEAAPVVAGLLAQLAHADAERRFEASNLLVELGALAVPPLIEALTVETGDRDRQVLVARALGRIGAPAAVEAVPRLVRLLDVDLPLLEAAIVEALGELAPHAPAHEYRVREAMVGLFRADAAQHRVGDRPILLDSHTRRTDALRTWSRTFVNPEASVEALCAQLRDNNPFVRQYGAELLAQRAPQHELAIAALARAVVEEHPKAAAFRDVDGAFVAEVQVDFDKRIQHGAARALVRIAPDDPRAVPAHMLVLERADSELQRRSAMALGMIGAPAAVVAVPLLVRLLDQGEAPVEREVVMALGMLGRSARSALPALRRAAKHTDPQVAARAAAAIRLIESDGVP